MCLNLKTVKTLMLIPLLSLLTACEDGGTTTERIIEVAPTPDSVILYATTEGIPYPGIAIANGGQISEIDNDGFHEIFLVNQGANYSLTIASQPPTHSCEINNATGIASGSDVRNISINCAVIDAPPIFSSVAPASLSYAFPASVYFSLFEIEGQDIDIVDISIVSAPEEAFFTQEPYIRASFPFNGPLPYPYPPYFNANSRAYNLELVFETDTLGTYEIAVEVSDGNSSSTNLFEIDIVNLPPQVSLAIFPTTPRSSDQIAVQINAYDQESQSFTTSIDWFVNDIKIDSASDSPTLTNGVFVKGDTVRVDVTVDDGATALTASEAVVINDSIGRIDLSELVASTSTGETIQFNLLWDDPDLDPIPDDITISGPPGAAMDDTGLVTWTTPDSLGFITQEYEFQFYVPSQPQIAAATKTIVVTDSSSTNLVRTGVVGLTSSEYGAIVIANIDGVKKIAVNNGAQTLYTLTYNEPNYQQDWVLEAALSNENLVGLKAFDIDGDGNDELLTASGSKLLILYGRQFAKVESYDLGQEILSFDIANINSDSAIEIALLTVAESYSTREIILFNPDEGKPLNVKRFSGIRSPSKLALGNVDSDTQLEIILNDGSVFDGETLTNQWLHSESFGAEILAADLTGDNIDEIISKAQYNNGILVFDAQSKLQLAQHNSASCKILAENLTGSAAKELILAPCYNGNLVVTSFDGSAFNDIFSSTQTISDSTVIAVGNTDGDDDLELVVSGRYIGESHNAVINVLGVGAQLELEWNSKQLAVAPEFYPAGSSSNNSDSALFLTSGYWGDTNRSSPRLVEINRDSGEFSVSDELATNAGSPEGIDIADIDDDGIDEYLIAFNTGCEVISSETLALEQRVIGTTTYSACNKQSSIDINNDQIPEFLFITSSQLHIRSLHDQTSLFVSDPNDQVSQYTTLNIDSDPELELAVSGYFGVKIYDQNENGIFTLITSSDFKLRIWASIDTNGDGIDEIIASTENQGELQIISSDLNIESSTIFAGSLVNVFVPKSQKNGYAMLLTLQTGYSFYSYQKVLALDAQGQVLWRSAPLIGRISDSSFKEGKPRADGGSDILIGTSDTMYIIK